MMLKAIIIFVLYFFEQKFAFALPINADNAIETLVEGEYSADTNNNIFGRNPAPYVPELPFIVTPNENNALYPIQFPQYNNQFDTNGLQSEFSAGLTVPFSSGQLINPSGFYDIRGVEENFATSDPSGPHFKNEVFDLTSESGQKHYENGQLVEQIPNPSQMTEQGGDPITMNNNPPSQQPPIQQQPQPSIPQQTPVQQQAPMKQQSPLPQQPLVQQQQQQQQQQPLVQQQQQQQPLVQQQQPTTQQPQSSNINTQQMQQGGPPQGIVKMSSTAAASSTFRKQENGQPPEVVQTAGISHLNYDSTRPNPVNGGYVAAGEYIPNANDPNQSYYSVSHGLYPNQLQTHSQPQYSKPQPQNPQLYSQPQPYSQPQSYSQPQAYSQPQQYSQQNPSNFNIQPNRLYPQQANAQLMNSQQTESRQNQQIPFNYQNYRLDQQIPTQAILSAASKQMNNLGQLPNHAMGAINNFFQIFPKLAQDVVNDGLQLVRIPFDMGDAALEKFITDLDNVHFNRFAQAPAQGGRTVLRTIQNVFDQMQTNMQPQQAVAGLVRRAPQPWMIPDVGLSSSYDSAQRKFNEMKSDISTRFPPLSFPRISSFIPSPQLPSFSQNPIVSQPAINGEPIVKAFSSSISESTQSSSINGAPPEVAHQAQGFTSEYDSTKTDEPFKADAVALESYIPNINDPTKGIFRGYEDSYPSKRIDA